MTVTPKVYRFSPGAKTGVAVIDGVKRCMDAAGTHHWEVVAYSPGSTITLRDKATLQRQLRLAAITSGSPANSLAAYYSSSGGANESPSCWITGSSSATVIGDSVYGMGTNESYVVETEDAISVMLAKGSDGGSALLPAGITFGVHAGRVFSAHNRSDAFEEGILAGSPTVLIGSDLATTRMLGPFSSGSFGTRQSLALIGGVWTVISSATSVSPNGDRFSTTRQPILANVGDSSGIERLVPYPVTTASGAIVTGHYGYTRYLRARRYGFGDVGPGGVLIENSIFASDGAPTTIGWRHNCDQSNANYAKNCIHIWCPPGAETLVD